MKKIFLAIIICLLCSYKFCYAQDKDFECMKQFYDFYANLPCAKDTFVINRVVSIKMSNYNIYIFPKEFQLAAYYKNWKDYCYNKVSVHPNNIVKGFCLDTATILKLDSLLSENIFRDASRRLNDFNFLTCLKSLKQQKAKKEIKRLKKQHKEGQKNSEKYWKLQDFIKNSNRNYFGYYVNSNRIILIQVFQFKKVENKYFELEGKCFMPLSHTDKYLKVNRRIYYNLDTGEFSVNSDFEPENYLKK